MVTETTASVDPNFLENLSSGMNAAPEPLPDGAIPDGQYTVRFLGATPGVSKNTGTNYINLDFEVLGPDEALIGTPTHSHFNLIKDLNFEIFKKTLRRMGVTENDGPEILQALEAKVGSVFAVTAKSNKGYFNLFINREVRA